MSEQYTYAVARIRALEVSLFSNAVIDQLIACQDYGQCLQFLGNPAPLPHSSCSSSTCAFRMAFSSSNSWTFSATIVITSLFTPIIGV